MINEFVKPKIGISTCLLGEAVRYNGGHKLDHYIRDTLGKFVDFVPICPEVEAGFGTPREALHLHETENGVVMLTEKSKEDLTEKMTSWSRNKLKEIEDIELCGYIFKSKSPSCGVYRARIQREEKGVNLNGRGLFAQEFISAYPQLIVEEEGRLHDPVIRDNFIQNIFINHRWNELNKNRSIRGLMKFHESLKYSLMSHSPRILKEMGPIVANSNKIDTDEVFDLYKVKLVEALKELSDKKKNKNVLDHIMGYFKNNLDKSEKAELKEVINNYYNGLLPIIVPITLLNHYVKKYDDIYLQGQFYLNPHPLELMLRNHV